METDRKWIIVRIDGKLAGISRDYGKLADISARIAQEYRAGGETAGRRATKKQRMTEKNPILPYGEITAKAATFEDILKLRQTAGWEEMMIFGTDFQKRVWRKLWELSQSGSKDRSTEDIGDQELRPDLLSYSDFAELCDNKAGVRAVAHAVALNPLPVVIPCHLIVPKESIDKIMEIQKKAATTIFKGDDLCLDSILQDTSIDFGEYALGKELKRKLISLEVTGRHNKPL